MRKYANANASTLRPNEQNGSIVSWKLCLNLCSRKWCRSRHSLKRYLIPSQLRQIKTLFGDRPINDNKLFCKTPRLAELRRLGSNLLHSVAVDGKNNFWKSYIWYEIE